jgi:uncharacterized protein with HEPN domain
MDKKNINCKFTYKCGICGKEYNDILDRAKCEIACAEKAEEEARNAGETKKEIEYAARKAKVDQAYETFVELRNQFVKDYGSYEYRVVSNCEKYLPFRWMW